MILPLVCLTAASVGITILPSNPTDRLIELIALIMFFVGVALAYSEVVRWWKARLERYERPLLRRRLKKRLQHWQFLTGDLLKLGFAHNSTPKVLARASLGPNSLEPTKSPRGLSGNNRNLDLLRACAVMSVYFGHLLRANHVDRIGPISIHNLEQTGVMIFFVHTTLVLMLSMDRMDTSGHKLALAFYLRRLFRIYPLSMFIVLFVVLFHVPRFFPIVKYDWLGWRAFLSNLAITQNLTLSHNFLIPLWSLPLEVQMYVLLPALFFLLKRYPGWHLPFVLWCIGVLLASLLIRFHASHRLQLGMFVPFFLAGVIAFALSKYRSLGQPSWGWIIAIAVAYAIRQVGFRSGWIACLLLGVAAPQFREISQKNVKKMAAWVARYSYGIYLSHMIIFWYVLVVLAHTHLAIRIAVCVTLSIVCPVVLYHLIEKPMINTGVKLANFIVPDRRRRPIESPVSDAANAA